MAITAKAIEYLESAGDWKGRSTAACVFADAAQAKRYLDTVLPNLVNGAGGGPVQGSAVPVRLDSGSFATTIAGCVVIITAWDMCHVDD